MKKFRHKVQINISSRHGEKQKVISGTLLRLPQRLLKMLFGELTDVMVIAPGKTVEGIEIKEVGTKTNDEELFIKAQGNGE